MAFVDVNGVRLAYRVEGSGYPFVFVHGGFGGIESRFTDRLPDYARRQLAKRFTLITYDRRGCGLSGIPDSGYDVPAFADDLRGLMRHLGIEQAHAMGVEAGGVIAMQFAHSYPEAVDYLVLVETSATLLAGEQGEPLRHVLAEREALGPDAFPEEPAEAAAAARERAARPREQMLSVPAEERRRAFDAFQKTVRAFDGFDFMAARWDLMMPVFVLHGADDDIVPPAAAIKLSDIKHSTVRIRPEQGHGMLDRPDSEAIDTILEWLRYQDWRRESGEADEPHVEEFN